ncbi:PQQ-like beta-propeller repeat protein [Campylobacter sp. 19-13652]|uniref:PQQ-like beta-propeller repeat protein n=1 Tax=Campylobacter sp. 19-13652 TaxID=2840180 RepID=UPI001C753FCE|nr:PQQ-like beta-propeller repeat protein [Campylobacter sp. 19-13652]BCX79775.1 lipoprotein [Campylobacter sp. 19-13652]
MKKTLLITMVAALVLVGCSTKRQYFETENIEKELSYTSSLSSSIVSSNSAGATLKNGDIITKDGVKSGYGLDKGYSMLSSNDGLIIAANIDGDLRVKNSGGISIYSHKFPEAIVSAALKDDQLAAISANNNLYLLDINKDEVLMQYASREVYAIDSRAASPVFLGSIIIYPSLDGKIYILNRATSQLVKDVTISSDEFFNNVIFLDTTGDTMIAATAKRVISISPEKTVYYDGEIKDVLVHDKDVYILKKDGTILRTDLDLVVKNKAYFKFAIFTGASINDGNLYAVEKTGYLFKMGLDLSDEQIYKLPSEIDERSYISGGTLYFGDRYLNLK